MKLKFDFSAMSDLVIDGGISGDQIESDRSIIDAAYSSVMQQKGSGQMEWTNLPHDMYFLGEIEGFCSHVRKSADSLVVFGIGGSSLGCQSLAWSLLHLNHNQLSRKKRGGVPKLYIEDNVDPEKTAALLDTVDIKKTYFNFVTKSGETLETLSQFLVVYDRLKKAVGVRKAAERIFVTTTDKSGSLFDVAVKEGFNIFNIPKQVGGRFSVFSAAAIVPLAIVGIDIKMLLKGAAEMDEALENPDIYQNPALMSAYLHYKAAKSGKNISVMMPYSEALKYMSNFFAQLWGESLGKATDIYGNPVPHAQTPVKAMGATDQHSQIQLYTQGPRDKIVTFLAVEEFREGIFIPNDPSISDFAYIKGRNFGELMASERQATAYALTKQNRPNYTIFLPCICEFTTAELLTYFMYQTVFAASFFGVNAFDQPGVEDGKKAAYAYLGRIGFSDFVDKSTENKGEKFKMGGEKHCCNKTPNSH